MNIKVCANQFCKKEFETTDFDVVFYQKMDVLEPKICPDCRQQRRLSFRNERKLYHNTCGLCRKTFVSIYSPDKPFTVYCAACWWGDGWDPLAFGREFDFSRPFFEQFAEVWKRVPKLGFLSLGDSTNSDYCNDAAHLLNCYLIFDGDQARDCYYGESFANITDCCDFLFLQRSELCYECTNCNDCYNLNFSRHCNNCSDSNFLVDCRNCRNCFGCINLEQQEYCIFNKQYSAEEYAKIVSSFYLDNYDELQKIKKQCADFFQKFPRKLVHGIMNENVTGDNLNHCKDTFESYDCANLQDCKFCTNMLIGATDCYDINIWGDNMSRCYNCACVGLGAQDIVGSYYCGFGGNNIFHSTYCLHNVENLFGCDGLKYKKFCILNMQYLEGEYRMLVPKIIAHMKSTGEWGVFFPPQISAFGYNETVANEYYSLTKEVALAQGFRWYDPDPKEYQKPHDDILACEVCAKNFKIAKPELIFYQKKNLPHPRKCPDCRHVDRLNLRGPRRL